MHADNDPFLLDRIRNVLDLRAIVWEEKKMFGGYCFMVDDKVLLGTFQGGMMSRVGPDLAIKLVEKEGAEYMRMKGRPMKGFLMVDPSAYETDEEMEFWVDQCLAFNPLAKSSKKKKK